MSRLNALKPTIVIGIAFVALRLLAASPSSSSPSPAAAPGPAPLANSVVPAGCGEEPLFSTAPAPEKLFSTASAPDGFEPATPGCKRCKDQPFCGCTYQGHPRISCDPCCYAAFPAPICLS
jgi:hypothetical protein